MPLYLGETQIEGLLTKNEDGGGGSAVVEELNVDGSGTFTPGSGVDGFNPVKVPAGTEGTPTATKGAVSNNSVQVTPKVTNSGGFIAGGVEKAGAPVTVQASELVSGNKEITANGNNIDVANYSTVSVNVASSGKAAQIASGFGRVANTAYTAVSGQSITVGKTGTYDVYWVGYRSSTSGTNGSQLYVGNTAHSSGAQTTFDGTYTNWQIVHLTNVSLTKDQVVTVRARSRGTSYYMYVANLTIIEA